MSTDMDILRRALAFEEKRAPMCWEAMNVSAGRADINRLVNMGLIELRHHSSNIAPGQYGPALYKITEKGRKVAAQDENIRPPVSAAEILEAMSLIVGFDDIKETIAYSIEARKRIHFTEDAA